MLQIKNKYIAERETACMCSEMEPFSWLYQLRHLLKGEAGQQICKIYPKGCVSHLFLNS